MASFLLVFRVRPKHVFLSTPVDIVFYSPSQQKFSQGLSNLETIKEQKKEQHMIKENIKSGRELTIKKKNLSKKTSKKSTSKLLSPKQPVANKKKSSVENNMIETFKDSKSSNLESAKGGLHTGVSFNASDFKYPYYMAQIRRKVENQWHWLESFTNLRVVIYFKISKVGEIFDIVIKESSGNVDYDKNAVNSVRRAMPFPELPDGYEGDTLGVFFEFTNKSS